MPFKQDSNIIKRLLWEEKNIEEVSRSVKFNLKWSTWLKENFKAYERDAQFFI